MLLKHRIMATHVGPLECCCGNNGLLQLSIVAMTHLCGDVNILSIWAVLGSRFTGIPSCYWQFCLPHAVTVKPASAIHLPSRIRFVGVHSVIVVVSDPSMWGWSFQGHFQLLWVRMWLVYAILAQHSFSVWHLQSGCAGVYFVDY